MVEQHRMCPAVGLLGTLLRKLGAPTDRHDLQHECFVGGRLYPTRDADFGPVLPPGQPRMVCHFGDRYGVGYRSRVRLGAEPPHGYKRKRLGPQLDDGVLRPLARAPGQEWNWFNFDRIEHMFPLDSIGSEAGSDDSRPPL